MILGGGNVVSVGSVNRVILGLERDLAGSRRFRRRGVDGVGSRYKGRCPFHELAK